MRIRLLFLHVLMSAGFAAVLARLAYVQIWRHEELVARAEQQSSRIIRPAPQRGLIVDRDGRVLAESVRTASAYADPTMIPRVEALSHRLSGPLGMSAAEISRKIHGAEGSFVWLRRFLPVEAAQAVEEADLSGVGLKWDYRRSYPNGALAAPLLGFVGDDGRGLSGMELAFDGTLIEPGEARRTVKDARGRNLSVGPPQEEAGAQVRLALDRTLQFIAERELEWGMERSRAKAGVVVVQDPSTGEILALAARPCNLTADRRPSEARGLSIPAAQWNFEPGSTFKLVTAAAALEEGKVRPQEVFFCENGRWKFADRTIRDHEPRGLLTFTQCMEDSSNIGMAKVGLRLGKETFYDYVRAFGFGSRTGSDIPGEEGGLLRPPKEWSSTSLPVMSFGQEVGVTALQLTAAYSALANGGTLMEPRVVLESRDAEGRERRWPTGVVVRRVLSPATAHTLTKILEGVILRGTGGDARLDGWSAAGKTGTAQKIDPATRTYSEKKYVASFIGFAPVEKPRLTIAVFMDEPSGPEWGGYNAGPVFRNIALHALSYLGVPPDVPSAPVADRRSKPSNRPGTSPARVGGTKLADRSTAKPGRI
jgi:cell division protein FtsI (penicillin-binding protein 3)